MSKGSQKSEASTCIAGRSSLHSPGMAGYRGCYEESVKIEKSIILGYYIISYEIYCFII